MKRSAKEPMVPQKQPKRSYLTWNQQMDVILISTLFEQISEGNKGDGEFKPQAYQAVADNLRNQLGLLATTEHVKNRIKVWKKHHSVITDIRTYTKFKCDDDKKMLIIPIEDHEEWTAYCKVLSHKLTLSKYLLVMFLISFNFILSSIKILHLIFSLCLSLPFVLFSALGFYMNFSACDTFYNK